MSVVTTTHDLELRRKESRHLIILKPALEECFLRSMKRANIPSQLPQQANELQALLNIKDHPKHKVFQDELSQMYQISKSQRVETFIVSLEDVIRGLL